MKHLVCTALLLALTSCGGSSPPPREYPHLDEGQGGDTPAQQILAREGLRDGPVMVVQRNESPVVTFRVAFDAGSAEDEPGRAPGVQPSTAARTPLARMPSPCPTAGSRPWSRCAMKRGWLSG